MTVKGWLGGWRISCFYSDAIRNIETKRASRHGIIDTGRVRLFFADLARISCFYSYRFWPETAINGLRDVDDRKSGAASLSVPNTFDFETAKNRLLPSCLALQTFIRWPTCCYDSGSGGHVEKRETDQTAEDDHRHRVMDFLAGLVDCENQWDQGEPVAAQRLIGHRSLLRR